MRWSASRNCQNWSGVKRGAYTGPFRAHHALPRAGKFAGRVGEAQSLDGARRETEPRGMAHPTVNMDDLYVVLRPWAVAKQIHPYKELSRQYHVRTNDWFEPHGSWDVPLGALNQHLFETLGAPALSALVILDDAKEPGGGFWGSAPSVPPRPKTPMQRLTEWQKIVGNVHAYTWPPALP